MKTELSPIEATQQKLTIVQKLLQAPLPPADSVRNVYLILGRILSLIVLWGDLRELWLRCCIAADSMNSPLRRRFSSGSTSYRVEYHRNRYGWGGGAYYRGSSNDYRNQLGGLLPSMPTLDEMRTAKQELNRYHKLADELDQLFAQSWQMMSESLPDYKAIKKLLPIGGRDAISVIRLYLEKGTHETTEPNEHEVFGFTDADRLTLAARYVVHRLWDKQREKKGKAPSLAAGRRLCRDAYINKPRNYVDTIHNRLRHWTSQYLRSMPNTYPKHTVIGEWSTPQFAQSPTLYKIAHSEGYRSARVVERICGGVYRNSVVTVLTGRPFHVGGDDYAVPAVWKNDSNEHPIQRGYLLLRRNWPDSFHHVGELPAAADVSGILDNASQYYFDRQRSEAERRLSQRQRIANLLRRLRKIGDYHLTLADSYNSGNCHPGTADFAHRLGIGGDIITGNKLAKAWRKAAYPQYDRFAPVVLRAEQRIPSQDEPQTSEAN